MKIQRYEPFDSWIGFKQHADLDERKDEYVLTMELPGVDAKEVHVRPSDKGLEVETSHEENVEEKKKDSFFRRSRYAGFYRYFYLGEGAIVDKARAKLKNGLLEIHVPRKEVKIKEIEVQNA